MSKTKTLLIKKNKGLSQEGSVTFVMALFAFFVISQVTIIVYAYASYSEAKAIRLNKAPFKNRSIATENISKQDQSVSDDKSTKLYSSAPLANMSAAVNYTPSSEMLPNQSYLDEWTHSASEEMIEEALTNKLYGKNLSRKMILQYEDMNRDYEFRKNYDLVSPYEQSVHEQRQRDFSRYLLRSVADYQFNENLKKAEKQSSEVRTFKKAHDTVQSVLKNNTNLEVSDNFKFGTKTDIPGQNGKVWMKSDYFDSDFDVIFGKSFSLNPMQQQNEENNKTKIDDRYRLSVAKDLGFSGLKTGANYGIDSTRMKNYIHKSITPNLSCEFSTIRGLNEGLSGISGSEETIQMSYGLSF